MSNLERYNKVFCEIMQVDEDQLTGLKFKESEYWDSVGHMTLIAAIEDEFDIMLEPEDMMSITSYEQGKEILSRTYNVQF
jgi:acyl carrier protein